MANLSDRWSGRSGIAALVLVMVFVVALFVMTFATSFQGSTTQRSYARAVLTRTCLEAAESAFAEAAQVVRQNFRTGQIEARCTTNWKQELLPPYTRSLAKGKILPIQSRAVYTAAPYSLELSDIEVEVVNWVDETSSGASLVRAHGVLEFRVTIKGARGSISGLRTVRQRIQYYGRNKPQVPFNQPMTLQTCDMVLLLSPIGLVID